MPHNITAIPVSHTSAQQAKRIALATWTTAALIALISSLSPAAHAAANDTVIEAVQLPGWVEMHTGDGERRPAKPGINLSVNDKVITAAKARMLLRLPDQSEMKLGEATEMVIEDMNFQRKGVGQPDSLNTALRLVTGVFWYATDVASKLAGNKRTLDLKLATATVGIRGTQFWSMSDADHDAVCVYEGTVAVMRESRPEIMLDRPGAFWVVRTGQSETPAGQATPEQLVKFNSQIEFSPGSGVLTENGRWRAVLGLFAQAGPAANLRAKVAAAGYPAEVLAKNGRFEVRINQFATEQDARTVVDRLSTMSEMGLQGARVALSSR